jgi:hypothetical protein
MKTYTLVIVDPHYNPNPRRRQLHLDVHVGGLNDSLTGKRTTDLQVRDCISPNAVVIREVQASNIACARARGQELMRQFRS